MLLALCLLSISFSSASCVSRLHGPGLRASFQVPVRYFYLQSYDTQGQRFNHSTQAIDRIEFHLTRLSDQLSVHSYRKVDDLHDGSYLFRYRLYDSVEDLHLRIRFGNEELEHTVKGYLYSDGCFCPESNRTRWSEALECPSVGSNAQLRQDFQIFDQIDMKQVIEKAKDKYFQHQQSYALCHYAIKNNKVGAEEEVINEQ